MFVSIHLTIQIKLCNSYTMESISDTHRDFLQFTRLGIRSMPPPPRAAWPRLSASGHRVSWSCQSSAAATRTLPHQPAHLIRYKHFPPPAWLCGSAALWCVDEYYFLARTIGGRPAPPRPWPLAGRSVVSAVCNVKWQGGTKRLAAPSASVIQTNNRGGW